jgi:DNA-binding NtrC family response regulator
MQTRARILIVDDEPVIADTLSVIFRGAGYEAFTAYNGLLGLSAARELVPNLVLTDVVMPGLDGVTMAMEICSLLPQVRVLLFSGQAGTSDLLKEAKTKGFDFELLQKPVHPNVIMEKVASALAEPHKGCGK